MGRMDITHRFAQQATDAFHRIDFDAVTAADILANSGPVLRRKALSLAVEIIRQVAIVYDYDQFDITDPDDVRAAVKAKQIWDFLDE